MMLSLRKLCVIALPLRPCVFYSQKSFRKPRQPLKKNWNASARFNKVRQEYNFGQNPGIEGQFNALDLTDQEMRDPNILDDMEQQFWNVDKIEGTLDREKRINQEFQGIYQVTRKQFKEEKSPNMLTWDEKQQIRTLHAQDPEKWTHMQLAFSFPATPSIIKKVLKAKWKLSTPEQIEKHDARVERNWDSFLKDDLEVPNEDLKNHLQSFSKRRKILPSNRKDIVVQTAAQGMPTENSDPLKHILKGGGVFTNIYKSYKPTEQVEKMEENVNTEEEVESSAKAGLKRLYEPPQNDTFIIPKVAQNVSYRTSKPLTLDNMKNVVMQDLVKGKTLEGDEMNFVQEKLLKEQKKSTYTSLRDPIGRVVKENRKEVGINTKTESSNYLNATEQAAQSIEEIDTADTNNFCESTISKNDVSKFIDVSQIKNIENLEDKEIFVSLRTAKMARSKMDDEIVVKAVKEYVSHSTESYPLEIAIPKDKWKKGALYRVKDRFYTDDGEFLFRVPGVSMK